MKSKGQGRRLSFCMRLALAFVLASVLALPCLSFAAGAGSRVDLPASDLMLQASDDEVDAGAGSEGELSGEEADSKDKGESDSGGKSAPEDDSASLADAIPAEEAGDSSPDGAEEEAPAALNDDEGVTEASDEGMSDNEANDGQLAVSDLPAPDGKPDAAESETPAADAADKADAKKPDLDRPYSLRLLVGMSKGKPRQQDAVLGDHDGVYLLGFPNEKSLAEAESYYQGVASWVQRDVAMGAAEGGTPSGNPKAVVAGDDALTLLDEEPSTDVSAAGKPLVALIDTGAPADACVVGSATFIGDDEADHNGHATAMMQAMKLEDPDVRVLALKALGDDGRGSASSVYAAIEHAVESGAKIINLSLAGSANEGNAAIEAAVKHALAAGCIVVAAAGNGGYDANAITPANIDGVFTVGACDADGNVLESSNRGSCVDGYVEADSTSQAAARVSGWLSKNGVGNEWREGARCSILSSGKVVNGDASEAPDNTDLAAAAATHYAITIEYTGTNATASNRGSWYCDGQIYIPQKVYKYRDYEGLYGASTYTDKTLSAGTAKKRVERMVEKPKWANHYFRGFNTDRNGNGTWLVDSNGTFTDSFYKGTFATGDMTIYMVFNTYDVLVTLNDNGGSGGNGNVYMIYGSGVYRDAETKELMGTASSATSRPVNKPTRNGYVFDGYWDGSTQLIDANGCITSKFTTTYSSTDFTIYAKWNEPPTYNITLSPNGGNGSGTVYEKYSVDVYRNSAKTEAMRTNAYAVSKPTRTGYTFTGYNRQQNGSGATLINADGYRTSSFAADTFSSAATIYAQWDPNVYSVALDNQGANVSAGPSTLYEKYNTGIYTDSAATNRVSSTNAVKPAKSGLVFNGYWTGMNGQGTRRIAADGTLATFGTTTYSDNNGRLYADWLGYKITLNDDGGRNDGTPEVYERYGTGLYLDSHCTDASAMAMGNAIVIPTKANYRFGGYYTGREGQGTQVITANGQVNTSNLTALYTSPSSWPEQAKSVYAKWIPAVYEITLDANNPDSVTSTLTQGSTNVYERYNVSVHLTDADANVPVNEMTASANFIAPPTKVGYIFQGYYTYASGGTQYIDENGKITPSFATNHFSESSSAYKLYAHWEKIPAWEITLNDNNGSGGSGSIWEAPDDDVYRDAGLTIAMSGTANPVDIPTRDHHVFKGYYKFASAISPGTQYINNEGYRIMANFPNNAFGAATTIYAQWEPNVYRITLNNQGADAVAGTPYVYEKYGVDICLDQAAEARLASNPITPPKKTGLAFAGYYTQTGGQGDRYINSTGNKMNAFSNTAFTDNTGELFADYLGYKITLDDDGGKNDGTKEVHEKYYAGLYRDDHCTDLNAMVQGDNTIICPTKDDHTFGGYYTKKNGEGTMVIDAEGNEYLPGLQQLWGTDDWPEANKTVWAKWIPNVYKVDLDANNPDDNEATLTQNSEAVYERFGVSIHLTEEDASAPANAMTSSENCITPPTKSGYDFKGYYTAQESGTKYLGENGYKTSSFSTRHFTSTDTERKLYAHWEKIPAFKINLDDEGGTGGSGAIWDAPGDNVYLEETLDNAMSDTENQVSVPTKDHYSFKGYFKYANPRAGDKRYINEAGYRIVANFPDTEFTSEATIHAQWEPDVYPVRLDNQGADAATPGQDYVYERWDESVHLTEAEAQAPANAMIRTANPISMPARDGWEFGGYYTEPGGPAGRGVCYIDDTGYKTNRFANVAFEDGEGVLYAYWRVPPVAILPITGGVGENLPLLWLNVFAVLAAAFVIYQRPRRPQGAHGRAANGRGVHLGAAQGGSARGNNAYGRGARGHVLYGSSKAHGGAHGRKASASATPSPITRASRPARDRLPQHARRNA